jgi:hypothetical protein
MRESLNVGRDGALIFLLLNLGASR